MMPTTGGRHQARLTNDLLRYNAIELIFLSIFRFKKHEGLYFWSLLVSAFAIIVYQIGSWGNMFSIDGKCYPDILIMITFQNVGWIFMVTGQSLVSVNAETSSIL